MRLATIDLGSNTVRLLIADVAGAGRWRMVEADQRVTRLGEGLAASGRLGEAPAARTSAAVTEYVARARRHGAERVAIVATSAVREAANGGEFAAALERAAGEPVTVISGEREASLTLAGVLAGLREAAEGGPEGDTLVFDIGGGSTEYILARGDAAAAAVSLRLGVVDLTERHPFPERVEPARFRALLAEVAGRLAAGVPEPIRTARVGRLVGTAGTATTLAALDLGLALYDPARVQGYTLTRGAIQAQLDRLGALTVVERAALPCLEPGRADLIVPGLAIVLATLDLVGIESDGRQRLGTARGYLDIAVLLRSALLALAERRAVGDAMDRLGLTHRLVRRFVAGTTAEDALAAVARLNAQGLKGAVTFLGEHVASETGALAAAQEYLGLLDAIHARALDAAPSLKLTQLGIDISPEVCRANVARVAERGLAVGRLVWIDMEGSPYTERTLDLYAALRPRFSNLACVVQSALRRTPRDVERLLELGATVRLCKGAYREPPGVAYPDKADVDRAYGRLATRLLQARADGRGVYPAFATHDDRMQAHARERARALGVGPDGFEIQMLLGIRPELHARLRTDGLTVRVLVPYGQDWYGYFMRRLAERPANLAFLLRNLARR